MSKVYTFLFIYKEKIIITYMKSKYENVYLIQHLKLESNIFM